MQPADTVGHHQRRREHEGRRQGRVDAGPGGQPRHGPGEQHQPDQGDQAVPDHQHPRVAGLGRGDVAEEQRHRPVRRDRLHPARVDGLRRSARYRAAGPCSYGERPRWVSIPWAAYDQPSLEKSGGASRSGALQTTVACRTRERASSRSSPSASATWRQSESHWPASSPRPSRIRASAVIRPASAPRRSSSSSECINGVDGGRVDTTSPPSSTRTLPDETTDQHGCNVEVPGKDAAAVS